LTSGNGPTITEESAKAIVTRALSIQTTGAKQVAGSVGNQTFVVRGAGGEDVILKTGNRDLLAAEVWACGRARAAGLPAPEIATHSLSPTEPGKPFTIMRVLAGAPTSSPDIWRQAGKSMRIAHGIGIPGYGPLAVSHHGISGRHDTWQAALTSVLSRASDLVTAGVLRRTLADQATQAVMSSAVMHHHQPGVMLHRDLKPPHVFGDSGQLTGIIDWGDVGVGDPLFDIARVSMAGQDVLAAFLDGYELDLTPELGASIRAYRILWNLEALSFEFRAGGDWFDAYRDNIQVDVGHRTGL
jgi:aminoglycoside phosphotransferase (APT) family kinase protein